MFHAAAANPSRQAPAILEELLARDPGGAAVPDFAGCFPLHKAASVGGPDGAALTRILVEAHPAAARARERMRGALPLHLAVENVAAGPGLLEPLLEAFPAASRLGMHPAATAMVEATPLAELAGEVLPEVQALPLSCAGGGGSPVVEVRVGPEGGAVLLPASFAGAEVTITLAGVGDGRAGVLKVICEEPGERFCDDAGGGEALDVFEGTVRISAAVQGAAWEVSEEEFLATLPSEVAARTSGPGSGALLAVLLRHAGALRPCLRSTRGPGVPPGGSISLTALRDRDGGNILHRLVRRIGEEATAEENEAHHKHDLRTAAILGLLAPTAQPYTTAGSVHRNVSDEAESCLSLLRACLADDPSLAEATDNAGRTPLHLAASIKPPPLLPFLSLLVRQCPQASLLADSTRATPLHLVIRADNIGLARIMLFRADVRSVLFMHDAQGCLPVDLAKSEQMRRLLVQEELHRRVSVAYMALSDLALLCTTISLIVHYDVVDAAVPLVLTIIFPMLFVLENWVRDFHRENLTGDELFVNALLSAIPGLRPVWEALRYLYPHTHLARYAFLDNPTGWVQNNLIEMKRAEAFLYNFPQAVSQAAIILHHGGQEGWGTSETALQSVAFALCVTMYAHAAVAQDLNIVTKSVWTLRGGGGAAAIVLYRVTEALARASAMALAMATASLSYAFAVLTAEVLIIVSLWAWSAYWATVHPSEHGEAAPRADPAAVPEAAPVRAVLTVLGKAVMNLGGLWETNPLLHGSWESKPLGGVKRASAPGDKRRLLGDISESELVFLYTLRTASTVALLGGYLAWDANRAELFGPSSMPMRFLVTAIVAQGLNLVAMLVHTHLWKLTGRDIAAAVQQMENGTEKLTARCRTVATLRVHVERARDMLDTFRGTPDPYVELRAGHDVQRTAAARDTLNPVWDERLELFVQQWQVDAALRARDEPGFETVLEGPEDPFSPQSAAVWKRGHRLRVEVHDAELPRGFSCIGSAEVALSDLLDGARREMWVPFHGESEASGAAMAPTALMEDGARAAELPAPAANDPRALEEGPRDSPERHALGLAALEAHLARGAAQGELRLSLQLVRVGHERRGSASSWPATPSDVNEVPWSSRAATPAHTPGASTGHRMAMWEKEETPAAALRGASAARPWRLSPNAGGAPNGSNDQTGSVRALSAAASRAQSAGPSVARAPLPQERAASPGGGLLPDPPALSPRSSERPSRGEAAPALRGGQPWGAGAEAEADTEGQSSDGHLSHSDEWLDQVEAEMARASAALRLIPVRVGAAPADEARDKSQPGAPAAAPGAPASAPGARARGREALLRELSREARAARAQAAPVARARAPAVEQTLGAATAARVAKAVESSEEEEDEVEAALEMLARANRALASAKGLAAAAPDAAAP